MNTNFIVFVSLFLDLLAFTLILPLLPSTLECFAQNDKSGLYNYMQTLTQSSQSLIGSPEKFNKALFGGLLGSWFSLLQFISMPIVGSLSDRYGRRVMYLITLTGISTAYILWNVSSGYFSIFVLFRTLGGLSRGNVSLSTAIITDVNSEEKRGKGFAMIGIAFSIGFLIGPLIGAVMSTMKWNTTSCFQHFPPLVALSLSLVNIAFAYRFLPETLPYSRRVAASEIGNAFNYINPRALFRFQLVRNITGKERELLQLGGLVNFIYLFIYSGLEFTLTFLTYIRFNYNNMDQGKLYFGVGIVMLTLQGGVIRRINVKHYPACLQACILITIPSFVIIGFAQNKTWLWIGLLQYALCSASFVPTLSTIVSSHGPADQKGTIMGIFRSIGALARGLGPLTASFLFWKYGIEASYLIGAVALVVPLYLSRKLAQLIATRPSSHRRPSLRSKEIVD